MDLQYQISYISITLKDPLYHSVKKKLILYCAISKDMLKDYSPLVKDTVLFWRTKKHYLEECEGTSTYTVAA